MSKTSDYLAKQGIVTSKGIPSKAMVRRDWDQHRASVTQCWICWDYAVGTGRGKHPFCARHLPDNQVQHRAKQGDN